MLVGVIDDLLGDLDVFLEALVRGVDHDGGEAFVDALLAELEGVAMVEVHRDWNRGNADGGFDELLGDKREVLN